MNNETKTAPNTPAEPEGTPKTAVPRTNGPTTGASELRQVPVTDLTANPHNVRTHLSLDQAFRDSVAANGVRQPLHVVATDGTLLVIAGHRRLAAAIKAGITAVPCIIETPDQREGWHDYVDQYTENHHRRDLTALEEADALFQAVQAGASKAKVARRAGTRRAALDTSLTAAGLSGEAREQTRSTEHEWNLEELAALADYDTEPEARARLISAADDGDFWYQVEREHLTCAERAEREQAAAEFTRTGVTVIDEPPETARPLHRLTIGDGQAISEQTHRDCPGHAVRLDPQAPYTPVAYCTDPTTYQHTERDTTTARKRTDADTERDRIVRAGNKAWRAARNHRRKFLIELIARKTAPEPLTRYITRAYLTMPEPLRKWAADRRAAELGELLAVDDPRDVEALTRLARAAGTRRLPLLQFAPLAAAYEKALHDKTWRGPELFTNPWERQENEPHRRHMAEWLSFLAEIGYSPAPIERAVTDNREWTPADEE